MYVLLFVYFFIALLVSFFVFIPRCIFVCYVHFNKILDAQYSTLNTQV